MSVPAPASAPDAERPPREAPAPRRPWQALTPRRQFALLCAFGMLMVATPLADTLRQQVDTLARLQDAERRVAPLHANVALQQALVDHRVLAAASLGARRERELDRQAQQGVVELRIDVLQVALTVAREPQALLEHAALRDDWRSLAAQIGHRRIDVAGSDLRHRLLLDQTIQIGDLLSAAAPAGDGTAGARLAWVALPGLERALAEVALQPDAAATAQVALRQAWRRVEQLDRLDVAARSEVTASTVAGDADARRRARQALDPWLGATPLPPTAGAAADAAGAEALAALRAWGAALRADHGRALGSAVVQAQARLRTWQIASALGALVLVVTAIGVARRLPPRLRSAAEGGDDGTAPATPHSDRQIDRSPRSEASRLFDRLRDASQDRAQPQDTGF